MKRSVVLIILLLLVISLCFSTVAFAKETMDIDVSVYLQEHPYWCDPTRDGSIDMKDIYMIRCVISIGYNQPYNMDDFRFDGDVNIDQCVDMRDVLYLRRYICHVYESLEDIPLGPSDPFDVR